MNMQAAEMNYFLPFIFRNREIREYMSAAPKTSVRLATLFPVDQYLVGPE
jgi:hypothetical protein